MNPKQQQQFEEMYEWFLSMQNASTIQSATDQAIRGRFANLVTPITLSSKSSSSEDQFVNEGGTGMYDVLKPPDAFLQILINGATKYIPIYT